MSICFLCLIVFVQLPSVTVIEQLVHWGTLPFALIASLQVTSGWFCGQSDSIPCKFCFYLIQKITCLHNFHIKSQTRLLAPALTVVSLQITSGIFCGQSESIPCKLFFCLIRKNTSDCNVFTIFISKVRQNLFRKGWGLNKIWWFKL